MTFGKGRRSLIGIEEVAVILNVYTYILYLLQGVKNAFP